MAKVHIGDEVVEFDIGRLGLHEALALQKATGFRPPELEQALAARDMVAVAGLAWLIVKFRMGHDEVTFDDICEGRYEIDLGSWKVEMDEPEADPTAGDAEKTSSVSA